MSDIKKNDLIKTRNLCNGFGFIDDLNFMNDTWEILTKYCNIYPDKQEICKKNTDKG